MEVVKIEKDGVVKTVEKGAVPIYAMRGWTVYNGEKKTSPSTTSPYGSPYTSR